MKLDAAPRAYNDCKVVFFRNGESKGVEKSQEDNGVRKSESLYLDQEFIQLY